MKRCAWIMKVSEGLPNSFAGAEADITGARTFLSAATDRKSTRLNSSHGYISYAVFCLKKKTVVESHHADAVAVCSSDTPEHQRRVAPIDDNVLVARRLHPQAPSLKSDDHMHRAVSLDL